MSCVGAEPCGPPPRRTPPPVPENKGGPVRVPPVTSAPEHLVSTLRHKGASVRASLYVGQRGGGQLVPGWPRCAKATR